MSALVREYVGLVAHTLAREGVFGPDVDDEIQRTFIAASTRLNDVRPGAEGSFLCQVARNIAAHARRTHARRRETPSDTPPELRDDCGTPEDVAAHKQTRELLDEVLAGIEEPARSVFALFELDELSMAEISARLGIPQGTVASRLRRAREAFRRNAAALDLAWELGVARPTQLDELVLLRRKRMSALNNALLDVGTLVPSSKTTHARTLAACLPLVTSEGPPPAGRGGDRN
jgi:RNA polymerase sigma-70 factor (ECF subfamily)